VHKATDLLQESSAGIQLSDSGVKHFDGDQSMFKQAVRGTVFGLWFQYISNSGDAARFSTVIKFLTSGQKRMKINATDLTKIVSSKWDSVDPKVFLKIVALTLSAWKNIILVKNKIALDPVKFVGGASFILRTALEVTSVEGAQPIRHCNLLSYFFACWRGRN